MSASAPQALRATQERFFALITAARMGDEVDVDWVDAPDEARARRQVAIYAGMYFTRLCDVLAADYPALAAAIGPALFRELARDYLSAHPSRHGSVRHFGRHLAPFLRDHPLADRWPFVADLAQLEHARGAMIDAADAAPVSIDELARVPAEAWPGLRFTAVPALRLVALRFPVQRLWLAVKEGGAAPKELPPAPTCVLTWRQGVAVYHRVIDTAERDALQTVCGGGTFAEACERLALGAEAEEVAASLVGRLRRWVSDGLLVLVEQHANEGGAGHPPAPIA